MFPITIEQFLEAYEKADVWPALKSWAHYRSRPGLEVIKCACPLGAVACSGTSWSEFNERGFTVVAIKVSLKNAGFELSTAQIKGFTAGVDCDTDDEGCGSAFRTEHHSREAFDFGMRVRREVIVKARDAFEARHRCP